MPPPSERPSWALRHVVFLSDLEAPNSPRAQSASGQPPPRLAPFASAQGWAMRGIYNHKERSGFNQQKWIGLPPAGRWRGPRHGPRHSSCVAFPQDGRHLTRRAQLRHPPPPRCTFPPQGHGSRDPSSRRTPTPPHPQAWEPSGGGCAFAKCHGTAGGVAAQGQAPRGTSDRQHSKGTAGASGQRLRQCQSRPLKNFLPAVVSVIGLVPRRTAPPPRTCFCHAGKWPREHPDPSLPRCPRNTPSRRDSVLSSVGCLS